VHSRFVPLLAVIVLVLTLTLVPSACSSGSGRNDNGRVLVLAIDGLEPTVIDLLLSEGKLPAFAELRRGGAYGELESMKPLLSPIIWTTVATGRMPEDHRIGHFVAVNEKTGEQLPVTSRMRRVKALWNIASDAGKSVAVVGWWATWPAERVSGTIVSDHACYHFLFEDSAHGPSDKAGIVSPPERSDALLAKIKRPGDVTVDDIAPFANLALEEFVRPFEFNDDASHLKWALATADSYTRLGLDLWREKPDLQLVYIEGVDSTSHLFGHLFRREGLSGELAAQQQRYGKTVEAMYEYADRILARYLEELSDDDTLVVLSDHGFELGALHGDPSVTRDMRRVSERFHKLEGVLFLYGRGVRPYTRIDKPKLLDVAPTVLALLGLPASVEMPGRVLTDALNIETVPARVETHETAVAAAADGSSDASEADAKILEHLESLGYLATDSPRGDRNLAAMHFEAGRYEDAAREFSKLVAASPEDGSLHASLAGALGALGRYDEALVEIEKAAVLSPINPEVHHNRGVLYERLGKRDDAIAAYRSAVRYDPGYEPSRNALLRLTGSPSVMAPKSDAEKQASALAEKAADAAKRGDYAEARRLVDEAVAAAPNYPLVYQYSANVAFLAGDRKGAIAALEKGIALEPGNALFRQNLRYLERAELPAVPPPARD
jgi:tetratricopeptide (TPR) repeat protein